MRMDQPILELRSITKKYPGVVALDDVSLAVSYTHLTLPTTSRV